MDSNLQSYIQTQNIGIAYETLLMLQLLKSGEHGGQRTTTEGGNYGNAELSVSLHGPALCSVMSHCLENQNSRPSETDLV